MQSVSSSWGDKLDNVRKHASERWLVGWSVGRLVVEVHEVGGLAGSFF